MLIFGERHLRTIPAQYERHYNGRRPLAAVSFAHPGPITLPPISPRNVSNACVLGGLINEYEWGRIEAQVRNDGRVLEPHRSNS